jgi:hypothetical protein
VPHIRVPPSAAQCRPVGEYRAHYSLTENKTDGRAVASNPNRDTCTAFTGWRAFTCRISARVGPVPAVARSTGLRGCTAQHNGLYIWCNTPWGSAQHATGTVAHCARRNAQPTWCYMQNAADDFQHLVTHSAQMLQRQHLVATGNAGMARVLRRIGRSSAAATRRSRGSVECRRNASPIGTARSTDRTAPGTGRRRADLGDPHSVGETA